MQTVSSNFAQAFAEDDIYMTHRVVVEFGSNRFNDGQVVTASSTKQVNTGIDGLVKAPTTQFWSPGEVFNNKNRNTMKWLVCDAGAQVQEFETGTGYRAINFDDGEYERGWWSANKSNGSGDFGVPEYVQSEWFMPNGTTPFQRRLNKITLFLTEGYRTMKEVTVSYKNVGGSWINVATNFAVNDGQYILSWDIPGGAIATGLRVRVHKTWDANDFARVSELQGYYIQDISEDIVDINIRESREEYEGTVPIGSTSANELSISVDNTTGRYNIKNTESDLYPYVTANNKVWVELGVDINQGVGSPSYEYTPMGEFYVDEWVDEGSSTTASFNARDFSKFIQDEVAQFSRVWTNTNVMACLTDVMARAGKMPGEEIEIDETALRGFEILFIKDQSIWDFIQQVSLADQGIFGFNRDGHFYYHSYNRLDLAPYNNHVYSLSFDNAIVDGTIQTELYANKVIVKVSPVSTNNTGIRGIWSANTTILQWSKLASGINSTATMIPVTVAPNQSNGNLTDNLWDDKNGYLWFPEFDEDGKVINGEIVRYASRTDSFFTGCERGYFGTEAKSHSSGDYIGEVAVFDVEFDNAPALQVRFPFVSAIDTLIGLEGEGDPQAHVAVWDYNPFGAKLVIGNLVNYKTPVSGEAITFKDFTDGNSENDFIQDFATVVSGLVVVPDDGRQEVGRDNEFNSENKDFIRRYGKNEITIDNLWIQSKKHAQDIADIIISEYRKPRQLFRLESMIPPNFEVGDRFLVVNYPQLDIENLNYHVVSIDWNYDGGLMATLVLREVKS